MAATKSRPWGNVKPPVGSTVNWGDPINAGLVGCWLMNEGGGNIAVDIAKNNHGTLTGGVSRAVGKSGKTLRFDGSNDWINPATDFGSLADTDLSVLAWVNPTTLGTSVGICGRSDGVADRNIGFLLWKRNTNAVTFVMGNNVIAYSATSTETLLINTPCLVAGTIRGTAMQLYVNAKPDGSATFSGTRQAGGVFAIGVYYRTALFWPGGIDQVRVYKRALIHSEIRRLYTEPFAGITEPRIRIRSGAAAPAGNRRRRIICGQG